MSSSEPFFPFNNRHRPVIKNDGDLQIGPVDGPDVLIEPPSGDPELAAARIHRDLPIRKPAVGEQLTEQQLAEELEEATSHARHVDDS